LAIIIALNPYKRYFNELPKVLEISSRKHADELLAATNKIGSNLNQSFI
jgi:hypothetical protein